MADITIHVLKPSVNNLTARIFVRAAGLDFEEVDAWGVTTSPEFLKMNPAHLTPTIALYLKADSALSYGAVVETMDRVRRAGIERLGMVTEPARER